jgi:alkylglycerol monooxygenase
LVIIGFIEWHTVNKKTSIIRLILVLFFPYSEVNLFWSTHQAHHSAESYNLSTALRQGVLQNYFSWMFYLPLALIIPPQIFLIHSQMNLLYQFWIHTDIISNLGPFEYILNTPSHHRVHHGRNPYCIDKNYGGVLIIWDRLFGTFAAERENEEIAYGLIHPINTFDPLDTQVKIEHLLTRLSKRIFRYCFSFVI